MEKIFPLQTFVENFSGMVELKPDSICVKKISSNIIEMEFGVAINLIERKSNGLTITRHKLIEPLIFRIDPSVIDSPRYSLQLSADLKCLDNEKPMITASSIILRLIDRGVVISTFSPFDK